MKIKALFFLFVFLLNTIIGFSCAIHMAHEEHHEKMEHVHHDNKDATHHQHLSGKTSVEETDACCQETVNQFSSLAKLVPTSFKLLLHPGFIYIKPFYDFSSSYFFPDPVIRSIPIAKGWRPHTRDIRITIQSFQI